VTGPKVSNEKVAVYRNHAKSVQVNSAATDGAQIGQNLYDPNGNVISEEQWDALINASSGTAEPGNVALANYTTDDLDEGIYNLYFTNLRAQNAVGSILQSPGGVVLTYVEGTSISADLNLGKLWMLK
jgi:hypothetical protein